MTKISGFRLIEPALAPVGMGLLERTAGALRHVLFDVVETFIQLRVVVALPAQEALRARV